MKILIFASVLHGNDAISEHAIWQSNTLTDAGHSVEVLTTFADSGALQGLHRRVTITQTLDPILALAALSRSDKIIVHFGIYNPLFDLLEIIPSQSFLMWDHNVTPPIFSPEETRPILRKSLVQRNAISRAKTLVADSIFSSLDWNYRDVKISPPPLRESFVNYFIQDSKRDEGLNQTNFIIVGRFTPSKGSQEILEFLNTKNFENFKINIVIPEKGNDNSEVKKLKKIRNRNFQVFQGIRTEKLVELYASSNFSLTFSKHEGLGLGQIEALAMGCVPIVWPGAGATGSIVSSSLGIYLDNPTAMDFEKLYLNTLAPYLQSKDAKNTVLTDSGIIPIETWDISRRELVNNYLPEVQKKVLLDIVREM